MTPNAFDGRPTRLHALARRPIVVRRGGVLLELLISIAIFATVAGFALSAMRSALDGVRRAELRARAEDLAASRLAELDAALVSAGELGDPDAAEKGPPDLGIRVEFVASPTGSSGISLARATVRERLDDGSDGPILAVVERMVGFGEDAR